MDELYTYEAVGRPIRSELALPWLCPQSQQGQNRTQPVYVTLEDLPSSSGFLPSEFTSIHTDRSNRFEIYVSTDKCYWFYEGVGTIRVCDGNTIAVSPTDADGCSLSPLLQQLIIGPGLRTVCFQQGHVVLHASTVTVGSRTVAFAGPSGQGKSTAAAACFSRGHGIVADDLTSIAIRDAQAYVLPTYPILKLDPSIAQVLELTPTEQGESYARPPVDVADQFIDEQRSLNTVYLLTDGERIEIEDLPPADRVYACLEASMALYPDSDREALSNHLTACGAVASSVQFKRLRRPRSKDRLTDVVRAIEADS